MPTKKKLQDDAVESMDGANNDLPRPRLNKLSVKNFRAIGPTAVEIELDDIVILVGPNNAGKSSILRAYELVMAGEQAKASTLKREDFHNQIVDEKNLPEVILETIVFQQLPDKRYTQQSASNQEEFLVRERWLWKSIDEVPVRVGYDFEKNEWGESFPWGPANIAQAYRPRVHRVDAFSDPREQAAQILNILQEYLLDKLINPTEQNDELDIIGESKTQIFAAIEAIRKKLLSNAADEIKAIETHLSEMMSRVFPEYQVSFENIATRQDASFLASIFKNDAVLKMGPANGFQSPVELQGSGARRTLLWNILRFIAENELGKSKGKKGKEIDLSRPHVLLLDEPEICLHPSAVRDACKTLYDLPKGGRWQVMVTTHSPVFVDLSRDNTTIVRVERSGDAVSGTTVYRPKNLQLSNDDRELLKLLNVYDPYVAEFFFGGRTILVEGDTEYTAFRYVCSRSISEYRDLHVVKARGKATLRLLAKILNQFSASYAVLHDSDTPLTKGNSRANPAWSVNQLILDAVSTAIAAGRVRLVASITNFETAYLGTEHASEKPYQLIELISGDEDKFKIVQSLLNALLDRKLPLPKNAIEWNHIDQLSTAVLTQAQSCKISKTIPFATGETQESLFAIAAESESLER